MLERLPLDLAERVLAMVAAAPESSGALCAVSGVNRAWLKLARADSIWRPLYTDSQGRAVLPRWRKCGALLPDGPGQVSSGWDAYWRLVGAASSHCDACAFRAPSLESYGRSRLRIEVLRESVQCALEALAPRIVRHIEMNVPRAEDGQSQTTTVAVWPSRHNLSTHQVPSHPQNVHSGGGMQRRDVRGMQPRDMQAGGAGGDRSRFCAWVRDQDVCEPTPCGLLPARPCADGWLKVHDDDHPLWEALDDDDECDDALVLAPSQWVELEDWALRLMQKEGLGDQLLIGLRTGSLSAKLQLHQRACLLAAEWLLSGRLVLVYEVCLRADRNVPWEASFDRNVPLEARLEKRRLVGVHVPTQQKIVLSDGDRFVRRDSVA